MADRTLTPRSLAATAAVAGGALLAGCGSTQIDSASVEKTIRTLVTSKLGVPVKSVACPQNVKLKTGLVSTCQVTMATGEVEPFTVTQRDNKGNVNIRPMDVIAGAVEKTIGDGLAQRSVKATVVCPRHVLIAVNATFSCTASDGKGKSVRFTATILDAIGSYRLRVG